MSFFWRKYSSWYELRENKCLCRCWGCCSCHVWPLLLCYSWAKCSGIPAGCPSFLVRDIKCITTPLIPSFHRSATLLSTTQSTFFLGNSRLSFSSSAPTKFFLRSHFPISSQQPSLLAPDQCSISVLSFLFRFRMMCISQWSMFVFWWFPVSTLSFKLFHSWEYRRQLTKISKDNHISPDPQQIAILAQIFSMNFLQSRELPLYSALLSAKYWRLIAIKFESAAQNGYCCYKLTHSLIAEVLKEIN